MPCLTTQDNAPWEDRYSPSNPSTPKKARTISAKQFVALSSRLFGELGNLGSCCRRGRCRCYMGTFYSPITPEATARETSELGPPGYRAPPAGPLSSRNCSWSKAKCKDSPFRQSMLFFKVDSVIFSCLGSQT